MEYYFYIFMNVYGIYRVKFVFYFIFVEVTIFLSKSNRFRELKSDKVV